MLEPERIEAQLWLDRARDDLGAATKLLRGRDRYPSDLPDPTPDEARQALAMARELFAFVAAHIGTTNDLRNGTQSN